MAEFKSRLLQHSISETSSNLPLSQSGVTVLSLEIRQEHYDISLLVYRKILAQLEKFDGRHLTHSKDNQFR